MFTSAIVSLALAASALANVFLTSPVASTSFTGGQNATLTWIDDGNSPSLAQFGLATFGIYAGNAIDQTLLQTLGTSVNVSATSSLTAMIQPGIGPDSDKYFVRVTSESYKNPSTPQYPEEAFSAMFSMTSMTGSFNSSVQAEINGESTAPIGAPTSSGTAASTASGASMTTVASASKASASAATTSAASSANSAGKPVIATGFVALVAALIGASLL